MDKNGSSIGYITPVQLTPYIQGRFTPTTDFSEYKSIFSKLEYAANNMLFSHTDEIERTINCMGFYIIKEDNPALKIKIKNLQIMNQEAVAELQPAIPTQQKLS